MLLIKNLFNLFSQKQLLIELNNGNLDLVIISKGIFHKQKINNIFRIKISETIFKNGIIYNPTIISKYIEKFISEHKLIKPSTFISIPSLSEKKNLSLLLGTLQTALCFSKAYLKIEKITFTPIFDSKKSLNNSILTSQNLLENLGAKNIHNSLIWLLLLPISILCTTILLCYMHKYHIYKISTFKDQIIILKKETSILSEKTKNFTQTKVQTEQLNRSIKNLKAPSKNPIHHLLEISTKIPPDIYLTNINFTNKKNLKKPHSNDKSVSIIELKGTAISIQSAMCFLKKLAENADLFKKIDLLHVQKVSKKKSIKNRSKNSHFKYQFKYNGLPNYIC